MRSALPPAWALVASLSAAPFAAGCAETGADCPTLEEDDTAFVQPGLDDPTARMWTRAGEWYAADHNTLDRDIETLLCDAGGEPKAARAVLTPHAGLRFSGPMAAQAWSRATVPDTVVVLGPNHYADGVDSAVWTDGPWLVPGHALAIEHELSDRLLALDPTLQPDREAFGHHEIEMNLPFLQFKNPDVEMVVATWRDNQDWDFRDYTLDEVLAAGQAVAQLVTEREAQGDDVMLLLTTDLVHYTTLEQAEERDPVLMQHIEQLDVEGLYAAVQEQGLSICGEVPTAIGMEALRQLGYRRFDYTNRTTSYDETRDESRVVGYPAGVIYR